MRAVMVREWTQFDRLVLENDVALPKNIHDNHVRIKIAAVGVSFATTLVVSGRYQRKPPLPFTPGTEVSGTIMEVGSSVSRFTPGERVVAALDWGGMAEQVLTPDATVYHVPDTIPHTQAIGMTNSYGTSYAALVWPHLLNVQAGQTLLVHGAAGGVGLAAVEIGKLLGATVIATVGSEEKRQNVLKHGADHAINYREDAFRDAVLAITDGRGADAVYDPVGGEIFDQSLRCMAPEGRICPVGFAGGTIPNAPANILLVKNITVCGLNMGYYYGWSPDDVRYQYVERLSDMISQLARWYSEGRISLTTSHTFELAQFQEAMQVVLGRASIGRVALTVD
jgi:NADPH2:quinone reductase